MRIFTVVVLVGLLTACSEPAEQAQKTPAFDVNIRWTSYGIPHVTANDWSSLGYGFAYATANDAVCVIARDVVMVNGELSRHFGAEDDNVASDVFHRSELTAQKLEKHRAGEDADSRAFTRGYVAGYNRFLDDHAGSLPGSCANADWVRKIDADDVARLTIGVAIRYGLARFGTSMVNAAPPGQEVARLELDVDLPTGIGSNAVGIGSALSATGGGILLGNPHYPWRGSSRFHMIHTTIPGELDVMGASLYTTTRIGIGFNKDVAWTHTVSTAARFTLYQLSLHPENPLRYRYGNEYRDLTPQAVSVERLGDNGELVAEEHTVWRSHYGPVIVSDELPWTDTHAYAVRDAVIDNNRAGTTYRAMHLAGSVEELVTAISQQGVYWTNTIAADRHGKALYADISGTPNVNAELLKRCRRSVPGLPDRVVVLNGADLRCEWRDDPRSAVPGALAADEMPRLIRDDYVANSNDSYWFSNPLAPLEGYSPIIGDERTARSLRTRAGLAFIQEHIDAGTRLTAEHLQDMLYSHRNFGAELLLDDVLALCDAEPSDVQAAQGDISAACATLAAWDRAQTVSSRGAQVWTEFWREAQGIDGLYAVPFDADNPVSTPRGLAVDDPAVADALRAALVTATTRLEGANVSLDAPWGEVQYDMRGSERIPIPGGQGWAGMWSMIVANLEPGRGYTPIVHGNSYIQVISWDEQGELDARGMLTYSQSEESDSPHYGDLTRLYAEGGWVTLPFSDADINADPNLRSLRLTE